MEKRGSFGKFSCCRFPAETEPKIVHRTVGWYYDENHPTVNTHIISGEKPQYKEQKKLEKTQKHIENNNE